jgi:ribonucleotide monophosphatase NagD (HAD superfamily)
LNELETRTLCCDLDGTLASVGEDYTTVEPIDGAREALSGLRSDGWAIVIYTARHFNHWKTTVDWLMRHGFEYDQLVFGKPPARVYVDDRAVRFEGDWQETVGALRRIGSASA